MEDDPTFDDLAFRTRMFNILVNVDTGPVVRANIRGALLDSMVIHMKHMGFCGTTLSDTQIRKTLNAYMTPSEKDAVCAGMAQQLASTFEFTDESAQVLFDAIWNEICKRT